MISFTTFCYIYYYKIIYDANWKETMISSQKMEYINRYLERRKVSVRRLHKLVNREEECIICFESYKKDDKVVKLTCDGRHIFHSDCIGEWFKNREACPICNMAIKVPMPKKLIKQWEFNRKLVSIIKIIILCHKKVAYITSIEN